MHQHQTNVNKLPLPRVIDWEHFFSFSFFNLKRYFIGEGQPLTRVLSEIFQNRKINSRSSQWDLLWQWSFSDIVIFSLFLTVSSYIFTVGKSKSSDGKMQRGQACVILYKTMAHRKHPRLLLLNHICNCLPCLGGNGNERKSETGSCEQEARKVGADQLVRLLFPNK